MAELSILWESAAPFFPTAYGDQTHRVVRHLLDQGVDVMVRATTHHGNEFEWEGIKILPAGDGQINDFAGRVQQAKRYKRNVWIPHFDFWIYSATELAELRRAGVVLAPRLPIEHAPVSPLIVERLQFAPLAIVESRFAEREVQRVSSQVFCEPYYVPVSISHDYKPYPKKHDKFRVLMVKNNIGPRPNFPALLKSYRAFVQQNGLTPQETDLVLWTQTGIGRDGHGEVGQPLRHWCNLLGISEYVKFPADLGLSVGAPTRVMAEKVFSQASVHVNTTSGESVGVASLEAAACGVPALATDWAGGAEHVLPQCRIPVAMPYGIQLVSDWGLIDEVALTEMLSELYHDDVVRRRIAAAGQDFVERFSPDVVLPQWMGALNRVAEVVEQDRISLWGDYHADPEVVS